MLSNIQTSYKYEKLYKGAYFRKQSSDLIKILCYRFIVILKIKVMDRKGIDYNK